MYELPSVYTLDRLCATSQDQLPSRPPSAPIPPSPEAVNYFPHMRTRVVVTDALQAAINSSLAASVDGTNILTKSFSWTKNPPPIPLERTHSSPIPYSSMIQDESKKVLP